MRVADVGWGVPDAGEVLGLPGALRAPDSADTPWVNPERNDFRQGLSDLENGRATRAPTIRTAPTRWSCRPIYGRWHAARESVTRLRAAGSTS